ncbi:MAG: Thimet oligopeptidase [Deltaproteobacteria bacterium]|nr:Thimet oligopeptidase [Deltaproteobacteria bacterium]
MVNHMRRTHLLALLVMTACGSSSKQPTPTPMPIPGPVAAPDPTADPTAARTPAPAPVKVAPAPASDAQLLDECRGFIGNAIAQEQVLLNLTAQPGAPAKRTIENTLDVFNELQRFGNNAAELAGLMSEVHPDAKTREAARQCTKVYSSFVAELMLDKRVFDAIKAVDVANADPGTKRFAANLLRDFRRAGVTLDDKKRTRIKELADLTTDVEQQISKNIAEDTLFIEVTDKARLDGMPADWIAAHKPDAKGVIKITTDYPDYVPFITYANDDELRKQLYIKFRNRGGGNEPLLQKLLQLRAEKAKILGFANWADYQSDDKMLRGGANAAQFIERISSLARTRANRDYAELFEQLKKHDPKATAVADWQKAWLENQVKKEKYAVDSALVRNYFDYAKALAGLLEITSTIYDVQYQPVADAPKWHPDVQVFDVMRKGRKLGRIFLDMHPRADKYKHAAQFPIKDGVAGKQLPEGALVCNFPDPKTSSGPALMDHGDVVTMFHEFGHLMHHVLGGNQHWIAQSGVATEQDFVEAPSQMFEEWGWNYLTLSRFAKHYQTGEVIPADLVAKMQKSRKFGVGLQTLQQMFYAALSLQFHQVDAGKLDQLATVKKLQARYTPFAYVEGTKFHTSFGHLVGYSSMYYTYLWSLVIAKDLLTPFAQPGLMATEVTYKYRDKILAAGGTKNAADLVQDFLGRKYDFKAYEKYLSGD